MSLHLGLHWNMVINKLTRKKGKLSQGIGAACFIAALVVALYGVWVFIRRDFCTYLFQKSEFVFLDYEESKILFYLEYLSLMGACIFISHYAGKLLRSLSLYGIDPLHYNFPLTEKIFPQKK